EADARRFPKALQDLEARCARFEGHELVLIDVFRITEVHVEVRVELVVDDERRLVLHADRHGPVETRLEHPVRVAERSRGGVDWPSTIVSDLPAGRSRND